MPGFLDRNAIRLLVILLLAAALRLGGIGWGLPGPESTRPLHPDEKMAPLVLSRMKPAEGQFNPFYFINPSLFYYTYGAVLWPVSALTGVTPPWRMENFIAFTAHDPNEQRVWFLTGRLLTVAMGLVTVWCLFALGSLLAGPKVGLLAAALLALVPAHVIQSHYLVVDAPAVMWMLLALYLFALGLERGRPWLPALAGLALGLGVATKYTAVLAVLPMAALWLQRALMWRPAPAKPRPAMVSRKKGSRSSAERQPAGRRPGRWSRLLFQWRGLALCVLAVPAGFLLGCPYSLLDPKNFLGPAGLEGIRRYNSFGAHPWRVLEVSWFHGLGLPLALLALGALALALARPRRWQFALATLPAASTLMLMLNSSPYMRHFVPLTPFLCLLAAALLVELAGGFPRLPARIARPLALGLGALAVLYTGGYSAALVRQMGREDNRIACRRFIEEQARPYELVAISRPEWDDDFFSVGVNTTRFAKQVVADRYDLVAGGRPRYLVLTEYERLALADGEAGRELLRRLEEGADYRVARQFGRDLSLLGLDFPYPGESGADWLYFCPEVTVYERKVEEPGWEPFRRGRQAMDADSLEQSIGLLSRAVELQDDNPTYLLWLGRACFEQSRQWEGRNPGGQVVMLNNALACTQRTLQRRPRLWDSIETLALQGLVRIRLGRQLSERRSFEQAEQVLELALQDFQQQKALIDSISSMRVSGWEDNCRTVLYERSRNFYRWGRTEQAMPVLEDLLRREPGHVQGLVLLAEIRMQDSGKRPQALEILERVLKLDPALADSGRSNIPRIIANLRQELATGK